MSGRHASARPRALLDAARARMRTCLDPIPERVAVVAVDEQVLHLFEGDVLVRSYPISTAARGIGGADGSLKTPPGTHVVDARIGDGEDLGTIFESREPTGDIWRGEERADDLILTRLITLDGCEPGVNRGPGCDSRARYIYVHGTNHEGALGRPASHGCIRMSNVDVVDFHDRVREGDAVVVV